MNDDRIEGAATDFGGKVKDAVGGFLGDNQTQAEGKLDQVTGTLQNAYGSAKDSVRDAGGTLEGFVQQRPFLALLSALGVGLLIGRMIDGR